MGDMDVHLVVAVVAIAGARDGAPASAAVRGGLNWMTLPKLTSYVLLAGA